MKIDPYYQKSAIGQNRLVILVSRNVRLVRIFARFLTDSLRQGAQTDGGVIENGHA